MKRVAIVGCSKQKLSVSAPARELYTGPYFKVTGMNTHHGRLE